MTLLADREHSQAELVRKLSRKGFAADVIEALLSQLKQQNLQSDQRYVEAYVRSRAQRGYGPVRIRQELRERGIDADLAESVVEAAGYDWFELQREAWQKKFRGQRPKNFAEKAKQLRFLQYRGFDSTELDALFDKVN